MVNDIFLPQYAARAIVDLDRIAEKAVKAPGEYRTACRVLAENLRAAVHIILPVNAEIYRGNVFGGAIPTQDEQESTIGVPAPITCLQYPWTHTRKKTESHEEEGVDAPKRITMIHDLKQFDVPDDARNYVAIFSIFYDEVAGLWTPDAYAVYIKTPPTFLPSALNRGEWDWGVAALFRDLLRPGLLNEGSPKLAEIGKFRPDITAVVQCCHALRAGARLIERTEQSGSRRRKFERMGVGGLVYHELVLPGGERLPGVTIGSHASPRLHMRRAHIRKLPTGVLTFVRQCFVGDVSRGVVSKHYKVKPQ